LCDDSETSGCAPARNLEFRLQAVSADQRLSVRRRNLTPFSKPAPVRVL